MQITLEWLNKYAACEEAIEFFKTEALTDHKELAKKLLKLKRYDWLRWGIPRVLNKYNKVKFAIFCAVEVLPIYEDRYPDDDRPSQAIEAAKNYLNNPCEKTAADVANAADAADTASAADDAAAYAASAAAYAAYAAEAAYAAYAAYAADAAAAVSAASAINKKIITYGLELIDDQEKGGLEQCK